MYSTERRRCRYLETHIGILVMLAAGLLLCRAKKQYPQRRDARDGEGMPLKREEGRREAGRRRRRRRRKRIPVSDLETVVTGTGEWRLRPSRPPIPFPLSIPSSTAAALLPPPRRGASRAPRGQRGSRARTSAAREVANTARRRARTSAVRSKCSSSQYGEAQRLHGLREVQGRKQPIRRAVPVRRPYGLRGVLDLAPTPPTRAGPPPGRRPHPHHQAPQRRPRLGVASEDFQQIIINTEAPCRSQRLAKYNTTTSF
ncbi:uncharacterized protein [Triticum aestivum]|uniref:uncharacterized protein n=1 Tax=Triticum aestivum TaxID=4565 RepID=UPI001D019B41|nr:uncharacterized protein LOC123139804 [Triticum aestivum]